MNASANDKSFNSIVFVSVHHVLPAIVFVFSEVIIALISCDFGCEVKWVLDVGS